MSEQELIEGCSRNDRSAQEVLYRKYFPVLLPICLSSVNGDRERALDVVNRGLLMVFTKIHSFRNEGTFDAWVHRVMRNTIVDYYRENRRYIDNTVFESPDEDEQDKEYSLPKLYAEDIMKLFDLLPPATAQVFKLHAIDGYSHQEIAQSYSITEGTSRWHCAQARESLRKMISERRHG